MGSKTWPVRPLGELVENHDALRVPIKGADRRPGPFPYYGASGVIDHVDEYIFDGEYLLVAEDGENLRTRNTPVAFLARGKFWVNNHAHIIRGNCEGDTRYLMYFLSSADISGFLTGSTMPKLTQRAMHRIPVVAPPLDEQRRIAAVLGALDDKIELNRKMNRTLEDMAQAIFKSWFIDFDGVPPSELVDSELGPIPRGWQVGLFGDLVKVASGKRQTVRSDVKDDANTVPLLGGAGQIGWTTESLFSAPIIVTGRVGTLGVVSYWSGLTWPSDNVLVVLPKNESMFNYIYESLRRIDLANLNRGSTQPLLTQRDLKIQKLIVPSIDLALRYGDVSSVVFAKIKMNDEQSSILAAIRDTLLPKLISGEIRVPEL